MAAIKTRVVLPGSHTIRVLYALLLIFGVNVTLVILRTVAMYKPQNAVLYSDFNVRFPANRYKTIVSAANAFGCGHVGNGTLELESEQIKCKRKMLRAALVMDETGTLRKCGFQEEYDHSIKGTPIQTLSRFSSSCWMSTLDNSGHSPLHKLFQARLKRGHDWRLRCLPSVLLLGSGRSGVTDLGEVLALHPHMYGPSQYENQAWVEDTQPGKSCQPFSRFVDSFDESAEEIRRINLKPTGKEHAVANKDIVFGVAPRYIQGQVPADITPLSSNVTLSHLPYLLKLINPDIKLIFMLRDPVERMFSDFYSGYSRSQHGIDIAKAFDTVMREAIIIWRQCIKQYTDVRCAHDLPLVANFRQETGLNVLLASLYSIYMRNWISVFPASQILILKADDYYDNRSETLNRITRFLKLRGFPQDSLRNISRKSVSNRGSRKFVMWEKTGSVVAKFFETYNKDLSRLLNNQKYLWS